MQKRCAQCGLPFECVASEDCWCQRAAAWQGARKEYADCLCETCLSLAFYHPSTLKSAWGIAS